MNSIRIFHFRKSKVPGFYRRRLRCRLTVRSVPLDSVERQHIIRPVFATAEADLHAGGQPYCRRIYSHTVLMGKQYHCRRIYSHTVFNGKTVSLQTNLQSHCFCLEKTVLLLQIYSHTVYGKNSDTATNLLSHCFS